MDKFMKALDFDSDTLGNVKRDMNFVLQRLIGIVHGLIGYERDL